MTMPEGNRTRESKVVLGEALDELRRREVTLLRFERELGEVRRAIKILEKAIGDGEGRSDGAAPKGDTKKAILDAIARSAEPLSRDEIAQAIGRTPAGWLSMQLKRMAAAGELVATDEDRYGLPSALHKQLLEVAGQ